MTIHQPKKGNGKFTKPTSEEDDTAGSLNLSYEEDESSGKPMFTPDTIQENAEQVNMVYEMVSGGEESSQNNNPEESAYQVAEKKRRQNRRTSLNM